MSELKKIVLLFGLFLIPVLAFTQTDCGNKLKQARELFESGQIEQIPGLLDSCLNNKGFNKNEENQAYRLLIQTYLFDYNRDKALEVMRKFLTKYPGYTFTTSDPVEIKELFDSYTVNPNWGIKLSIGTNLSQVYPSQYFSVYNLHEFNSEYTPKFGYDAGLHVEKYFGPQFGVSLGFVFREMNYKNKEISGDNLSFVQFSEKSTFYTIPFSVRYCIGSAKVSPFIFCGASISFLKNSTGNYINQIMPGNNVVISKTGSRNITETRNMNHYAAFGGLGLQYKIQKGCLKFWAGYDYSFSDFVDKKKRYQDTDNILEYNHIDDDIRLNHFNITISYSRLFYKIKVKEGYNAEN